MIAEASPLDPGRAIFSPDGKLVDILIWGRGGGIHDAKTGELLVDFSATKYDALGAAFTPDSQSLLIGTGELYLLIPDPALWSGDR